MSPAFSPTRYVISTRRKAKRELLLLPAMNDTIGQLDQPECCPTFQRDNLHRHFRVRVFSIGAGWCQALSDCSVDPGFDVARRGPRFSSGSALWPSHDGIRRMRRTNLTIRPCRKTYGRHQDSKRTPLIHRPCGDIAPPGRRNSVFSYRYCAQLRHDMMRIRHRTLPVMPPQLLFCSSETRFHPPTCDA